MHAKKNVWLWIAAIVGIIIVAFAVQSYWNSAYAERITEQEAAAKVEQQYPGQVRKIQAEDASYLILFEMDSGMYEVRLDAVNGDVLSLERTVAQEPDSEPNEQSREPKHPVEQVDEQPTPPAMLSQEEISAIALQQAAESHLVSLQQIQDSNGSLVHQAVIEAARERTIVVIDSVSGDVLSTSKETIAKPVTSAEEAANIALQHVGGGTLDDVELETDHGRTYYEVEIEFADDREVDVKIDAETGEIFYVEWDD